MNYVLRFLLISLLISCAAPPHTTILASTIHSKENWQRPRFRGDVIISTRRGVVIKFETLDVHIGKVSSVREFHQRGRDNYGTIKHWGIKLTQRF